MDRIVSGRIWQNGKSVSLFLTETFSDNFIEFVFCSVVSGSVKRWASNFSLKVPHNLMSDIAGNYVYYMK